MAVAERFRLLDFSGQCKSSHAIHKIHNVYINVNRLSSIVNLEASASCGDKRLPANSWPANLRCRNVIVQMRFEVRCGIGLQKVKSSILPIHHLTCRAKQR